MLPKTEELECQSFSFTNTPEERLSNVFDVIVLMQHINVMIQLFYSVSPGRNIHTTGLTKKQICANATYNANTQEYTHKYKHLKRAKSDEYWQNYVQARRAAKDIRVHYKYTISEYYVEEITLLIHCPFKWTIMLHINPLFNLHLKDRKMQEDKHTQLYSLSLQLCYFCVQLFSFALKLCNLLCRANFSAFRYLKLEDAKQTTMILAHTWCGAKD